MSSEQPLLFSNAELPAPTNPMLMSTVEIAELLNKRHDNVMRKAKELSAKGIINAPQIEERYGVKGNTRFVYLLNKTESLNLVANLSPEFTARIIKRWQELEAQQSQPQFRIPQNLPEALRLAAELAEQNEALSHERDEAVRTKAWISSSREAKAMARLGVAKRENERLRQQLGDSNEWKQVKAIGWLGEYFDLKRAGVYSQIGKALAKLAEALGQPPRKITSGEYGEINVYHRHIIDSFRGALEQHPAMLAKYRRAAP